MQYLYRGVNCELDIQFCGEIRPKGAEDVMGFMAGDNCVLAGNSLNTIDSSQRNAMHGHNLCSDLYNTSFVSFTTDLETAKKFATYDGSMNGFIYVVSPSTLEELEIGYVSPEAQVNDTEFEVLVNLIGLKALPSAAIIEKRFVRGKHC